MGPLPIQPQVLAQAAQAAPNPADLMAARTQMAVSLGWHTIIACFAVGSLLLVPSMTWLFVIFQREHNQQAADRSLV